MEPIYDNILTCIKQDGQFASMFNRLITISGYDEVSSADDLRGINANDLRNILPIMLMVPELRNSFPSITNAIHLMDETCTSVEPGRCNTLVTVNPRHNIVAIMMACDPDLPMVDDLVHTVEGQVLNDKMDEVLRGQRQFRDNLPIEILGLFGAVGSVVFLGYMLGEVVSRVI